MVKPVHINSVVSTNTLLKEKHREFTYPYAVYAGEQTAGRGQRGNSWHSEPGQNLLYSLAVKHEDVKAINQFSLSEIVAYAVVDLLMGDKEGICARIKWPNDIYVGDKKICGILIENSLQGNMLDRSIIGIGLNVNQKEFPDYLPNPVSMSQLTGKQYDLRQLAQTLTDRLLFFIKYLKGEDDRMHYHELFKRSMWRNDGQEHRFREPGGEPFMASITDVLPTGELLLSNGQPYLFKQIEFIL